MGSVLHTVFGAAIGAALIVGSLSSCASGSDEQTGPIAGAGIESSGELVPIDAMPEAMIGRWRVDTEGTDLSDSGGCDAMSAGLAGLVITIRSDGFGYFEEGGTLIEVHEVSERRIDATFDTTYVEQTESRVTFELVGNPASDEIILRATPNDDSFFVEVVDHLECPPGETQEQG